MSEQSDLDDVVAAWCDQPVESRVFSALEIRRAVARIETEARTTVAAMAIGTVLTMGIWIVLAAMAHDTLSRVAGGLTALAYAWNAALAIHRRRQLAAACMAVSELPSIEYYDILRDVDRHLRLAGGGWPASVGLIVLPVLYFIAQTIVEPSAWPVITFVALFYVGIHALVIPWARHNTIATYDEMARYKESRGLL